MTHSDPSHDSLPSVDVLDSGGDAWRERDGRRLKDVVIGAAAGALTYVALAHGVVPTQAADPPAASTKAPTSVPNVPAVAVLPIQQHGRVVDTPCRIRVRDVTTRRWLCIASTDAATNWLADERGHQGRPGWGGRT
jgi:hypothetical protein